MSVDVLVIDLSTLHRPTGFSAKDRSSLVGFEFKLSVGLVSKVGAFEDALVVKLQQFPQQISDFLPIVDRIGEAGKEIAFSTEFGGLKLVSVAMVLACFVMLACSRIYSESLSFSDSETGLESLDPCVRFSELAGTKESGCFVEIGVCLDSFFGVLISSAFMSVFADSFFAIIIDSIIFPSDKAA